MDLNRHIVKNSNAHALHSNGLAKIVNGDRVGSTSSVSFNQRLQIDKTRHLVKGYNRSVIGMNYGVLRAKQVLSGGNDSLQSQNSLKLSSNRRFSEPKSNNYHPYS